MSTLDPLEVQSHYQHNAAELACRYGSVGFEAVHRQLLQDLPGAGAQVLDVGAGNGRDTAGLAARGYLVTAVEPCAELRKLGRASARASNVRWLDDSLPRLERVTALGDRYDFVLCSAVLMHVAPGDLGRSFATLAGLLKPGGRLAATYRSRQGGESPTLFHEHTLQAVRAAAASAGLGMRRRHRAADVMGRRGVHWETLVIERRGA